MISRVYRILFGHIDGWLMIAVVLLLAAGLTVLYSASGESMARIETQFINMAVAFIAMWVVANIPPRYLMSLAVPMYIAGLLLLLGVALFGEIVNGARRWLDIGVARIQPSELMKIALPVTMAWYFNRYEAVLGFRNFCVAALLLIIPVALIAKQPDLGTAILISASGFYVLFFAGLSWRVMIGLAVIAGASLPVLWSVMHDYQRMRVMTLLDPTTDPLGAGYHIIQATIAVGSGGLTGKGWLNGTQTHLDFLPERTTDFIFAVFSEEFGLVGNSLLLLGFMLVIARGLVIAANATTLFSRLLAGAITMTFFTYAFVNMGMVSGILPVVGVPLPLISYGGTALVTIFLGFGILMSIQTHKARAN